MTDEIVYGIARGNNGGFTIRIGKDSASVTVSSPLSTGASDSEPTPSTSVELDWASLEHLRRAIDLAEQKFFPPAVAHKPRREEEIGEVLLRAVKAEQRNRAEARSRVRNEIVDVPMSPGVRRRFDISQLAGLRDPALAGQHDRWPTQTTPPGKGTRPETEFRQVLSVFSFCNGDGAVLVDRPVTKRVFTQLGEIGGPDPVTEPFEYTRMRGRLPSHLDKPDAELSEDDICQRAACQHELDLQAIDRAQEAVYTREKALADDRRRETLELTKQYRRPVDNREPWERIRDLGIEDPDSLDHGC